MKKMLSFPEFLWIWNETQSLATPAHHRRIARWLERLWRGQEGRAGLLMAFRSSGKSTVVGLFCAWVLLCDPNQRILVMAAEQGLARKMVRNVKRIIERHPLTRALVPPRREQWATDQFTVQRPGELRDPSMLARGIGGNITGARADIIICDDVEVPNTSTTPQKRADLRTRLSELDYVLVPGGLSLYVGTPHTWHSLYSAEPRRETGEERPFLDGFTRLEIPLVDAAGTPAWPERYPPSRIDSIKRRSGPNKFASQMLLRPVNIAEGRLSPDLLRRYDHEVEYTESNGEAFLTLNGVRMVSATCCWDPAWGVSKGKGRRDGSVIACLFTGEDGTWRLHRVRWLTADPTSADDEASQQCRAVARFLRAFHLPAVRVETNGLGRFLPSLLRKVLAEDQGHAAVIEYSSTRPKDQRIVEAFDAPLAAGALWAHASLWNTPFLTEMRDWQPGGGGPDDGLDAAAACLLAEPVRLSRPSSSHASPRPPSWRPGGGAWQARTEFTV